MDIEYYSLIVIGSGISGLYAALRANERLGLKNILMLTKSELKESNSTHAQGGIASVLPENTDDSVELHVKDTLRAGAGLSSEKVSQFISERGAKIIDENGNLLPEYDAAHVKLGGKWRKLYQQLNINNIIYFISKKRGGNVAETWRKLAKFGGKWRK